MSLLHRFTRCVWLFGNDRECAAGILSWVNFPVPNPFSQGSESGVFLGSSLAPVQYRFYCATFHHFHWASFGSDFLMPVRCCIVFSESPLQIRGLGSKSDSWFEGHSKERCTMMIIHDPFRLLRLNHTESHGKGLKRRWLITVDWRKNMYAVYKTSGWAILIWILDFKLENYLQKKSHIDELLEKPSGLHGSTPRQNSLDQLCRSCRKSGRKDGKIPTEDAPVGN